MMTRESYIKEPIDIQFELVFLLKPDAPLVIFDIGACEAEDSIRYSNLFPNATVYAFEPRADNIQKAKELIRQYRKSKIVLENLALSEHNGTAEFYLSEGEPKELRNDENWNYGNKSSSLLAPAKELKNHTAWLQFNRKMTVPTQRLEDYAREKNITQIDFAHLDVQGAELMVLQGAGHFLRRIKLIWMEVEAVELYQGQPVKKDVELFMQSNHFVKLTDTVDDWSGDQLYANQDFFTPIQLQSLQAAEKRKTLWERLKLLITKVRSVRI